MGKNRLSLFNPMLTIKENLSVIVYLAMQAEKAKSREEAREILKALEIIESVSAAWLDDTEQI